MAENPQGVPPTQDELADLVRPFAMRVATINGLLAVLGIGIALYVYFAFPIPAKIDHHSVDRFGQPSEPENAILYLFVYPCFQVWLVVMPLWGIWRLDHQKSDENARQVSRLRAFFPWVTPAPKSAGQHKGVLVALAFAATLMLTATIFRSVLTAISSV